VLHREELVIGGERRDVVTNAAVGEVGAHPRRVALSAPNEN
jgi:hypothetical protein